MESIQINTTSKSYPIHFDSSFDNLYQSIQAINKDYSSYVIITDSNVGPLYQEEVKRCLAPFNKPVSHVSFEAGEKHKNLQTIETFYNHLIKVGADRKTLIIALGGGVCGDMAGFTASTYMRSIDFIQVPTTLLSQVDSSVGGKTGIDLNGYKNIVGAFYQPMLVYINVSVLKTLPQREFNAGMSEVVKHGFIKDKTYYEFIKENSAKIKALDYLALVKLIKQSCTIKKTVVDEDEQEHGCRALLNHGHTFGHAIERLKNFELVHGECVAIGMHGDILLSVIFGTLSKEDGQDLIHQIQTFDLPITVSGIKADDIYTDMFSDKKTTEKRLVFACLNGIGDSYLTRTNIDKETIMSVIDKLIKN